MSHVEFYCINLFFFSFQEITSRTRCLFSGFRSAQFLYTFWVDCTFLPWSASILERRLSVKRERKIYGRKLFLFHNFLAACRRGGLCCQKKWLFLYYLWNLWKYWYCFIYVYVFMEFLISGNTSYTYLFVFISPWIIWKIVEKSNKHGSLSWNGIVKRVKLV